MQLLTNAATQHGSGSGGGGASAPQTARRKARKVRYGSDGDDEEDDPNYVCDGAAGVAVRNGFLHAQFEREEEEERAKQLSRAAKLAAKAGITRSVQDMQETFESVEDGAAVVDAANAEGGRNDDGELGAEDDMAVMMAVTTAAPLKLVVKLAAAPPQLDDAGAELTAALEAARAKKAHDAREATATAAAAAAAVAVAQAAAVQLARSTANVADLEDARAAAQAAAVAVQLACDAEKAASVAKATARMAIATADAKRRCVAVTPSAAADALARILEAQQAKLQAPPSDESE
jgi:hypothetical protein